MSVNLDRILIIDYGSQYTQLIARRVREIGIYSEIYPSNISKEKIGTFQPSGVILSGSPDSVSNDTVDVEGLPLFVALGVPILGICFGMQSLASYTGGEVQTSQEKEFGFAQVRARGHSRLLEGIQDATNESKHGLLDVWMSHGDKVTVLPPGFSGMASTDTTEYAAMGDPERHFYGVQFHPEVNDTTQGTEILTRFVKTLCGCAGLWTADNIIDDIIHSVRDQVGEQHVILGLSGGVDSSVVAALLSRAIGDQLTCVFVDNGLLRLNEGDQVMEMLGPSSDNVFSLNIIRVDASDRFLSRLQTVDDPEQKRKIIGNTFIEVFDEESLKVEGATFLAQGTIYPDVIESAGNSKSQAHVIKSHHNVGGLPDYMKLSLVEPLRELFKDEVRRIGMALGLPQEMVYRHPFPGPGLGVRILGTVTREAADILRQADHIFIEELRIADYYDRVSQAFAVYVPVKSVGVVGDARRYEHVIALRAVETIDFMTARSARLPWELLERVSSRIVNEISGISRVTYDISSKPPATIEWE